jgi:hypothetical protein
LKNGIGHLSCGETKVIKTFSENQKKEKTYENIKKNIEDYKNSRNRSLIYLKKKNYNFNNSQPKLEKKLSKLYYKPINEIRLDGYKKALNKCLNLSITNKNFIMPKVQLNENDVYSRLYNNYILNYEKTKKQRKSSRNRKNVITNYNDDNNDNYNGKKYNQIETILNRLSIKNNEKIKNYLERNKRRTSTFVEEGGKKKFEFTLKSNISEQDNNKQFTMRITPELMKKCWKKFSGGPQHEDKKENKIVEKNDIKKILNYKILSFNKKNGEKKDISLFNTMIKDDPNLDSNFIKNKNYKDYNNNSNLHLAVKKNSIKLVKYFLGKNCDVNDINKNGDTALHIACRLQNEDIIQLLLEKGADITIKNNNGKKPFDLFIQKIIQKE